MENQVGYIWIPRYKKTTCTHDRHDCVLHVVLVFGILELNDDAVLTSRSSTLFPSSAHHLNTSEQVAVQACHTSHSAFDRSKRMRPRPSGIWNFSKRQIMQSAKGHCFATSHDKLRCSYIKCPFLPECSAKCTSGGSWKFQLSIFRMSCVLKSSFESLQRTTYDALTVCHVISRGHGRFIPHPCPSGKQYWDCEVGYSTLAPASQLSDPCGHGTTVALNARAKSTNI